MATIKRLLTDNEILKIVELCAIDTPMDPTLKQDIYNDNFKTIKETIKNTLVYPDKIDKIIRAIAKKYREAQIQPGEAVGQQAAQSKGAPTTQIALNAFHAAGKITRMTTGGLPRMIELTNCSKNKDIKNPSCTIYFTEKYTNMKQIPLDRILETRVSHIMKDYDIFQYNTLTTPWWYKFYQSLFGKINFCEWYLRLYLNKDEMYRRKVTPGDISDIIEDKISPVFCIYSPIEQGIIDIYIDTSIISTTDDANLDVLDEDTISKRFIRDIILEQIKEFYIKGVPDIKEVYPLKDLSGEYFVETDGSNLKGVLQLEFVSQNKTICNRPMEVYEIYGIIGLEEYYRREFESIFTQSASYVNPAWIDLIVHHICQTGKPVPVNRFGHMKKPEVSTFTKATFEEMITHLIRAAVYGYHDPLKSVAGSIVTGKRCKHGTGMIDVIIDPEQICNLDEDEQLLKESVVINIKKQKVPKKQELEIIDDDEDDDSDKLSDDNDSVVSDDDFEYDDDGVDDDDDDFADF